jgi:hypothetical protein
MGLYFQLEKDENRPFYPVYHQSNQSQDQQQQSNQISANNHINTTLTNSANNNNSKLLQAIHFNQSNMSQVTMSTMALNANDHATTSSLPSSSSHVHFAAAQVLNNHINQNNINHNHNHNHNHLMTFQKPGSNNNLSGAVVGNSITTNGAEHSANATKLM